jgi:signal transduction histidine kinase
MAISTIILSLIIVMLLAVLLAASVFINSQRKTNTILWDQYNLIKDNRDEEVEILSTKVNDLGARIQHAGDLISKEKSLSEGTRITILNILLKGQSPS